MNEFHTFIAYLKVEKRYDFVLSFSATEEMIWQPLRRSAYKYSTYWSDDGVHRLAKLIGETGFKAKPDLKNKQIMLFIKR